MPTCGKRLDNVVALLECSSYKRETLKETIDLLLKGLSFRVRRGTRIFIKPNLVTGSRRDGLACTNVDFVAAVAEWFLDHGAFVVAGDSPAFGGSRQVMAACGMDVALKGLGVALPDMRKKRRVLLDCGEVGFVSEDILSCDQLINLPKLKAHNQMLVTLAVKNLFGAVVGCRKALAHMRYGGRDGLFEAFLTDLVSVLPPGAALLDGIVAMHKKGPVNGEAIELGMVAASLNPVALDTAVLRCLGIDAGRSPLWLECRRRGMAGTELRDLVFPLLGPGSFAMKKFAVPEFLDPVRFQIGRFVKSGLRRLCGLG